MIGDALTTKPAARAERRISPQLRIVAFVNSDGFGGYYFFRPDPRKNTYRKPKEWIFEWGFGPAHTLGSEDHRLRSEQTEGHIAAREMIRLLHAGVAQAEEHRFRKAERAVSTIAPGSILPD